MRGFGSFSLRPTDPVLRIRFQKVNRECVQRWLPIIILFQVLFTLLDIFHVVTENSCTAELIHVGCDLSIIIAFTIIIKLECRAPILSDFVGYFYLVLTLASLLLEEFVVDEIRKSYIIRNTWCALLAYFVYAALLSTDWLKNALFGNLAMVTYMSLMFSHVSSTE